MTNRNRGRLRSDLFNKPTAPNPLVMYALLNHKMRSLFDFSGEGEFGKLPWWHSPEYRRPIRVMWERVELHVSRAYRAKLEYEGW